VGDWGAADLGVEDVMPTMDEYQPSQPGLIDKPFAYHRPSADGHARITRLRELFSLVERELRDICPESRQRAVALTNNEQTAMWAIKAVVFNDPLSEVEAETGAQ
jgi:hypothetical protein